MKLIALFQAFQNRLAKDFRRQPIWQYVVALCVSILVACLFVMTATIAAFVFEERLRSLALDR